MSKKLHIIIFMYFYGTPMDFFRVHKYIKDGYITPFRELTNYLSAIYEKGEQKIKKNFFLK